MTEPRGPIGWANQQQAEREQAGEYAAKVNAPLRPETIAEINRRIESGDVPIRTVNAGDQSVRYTADTITDNDLDQLYAEREKYARGWLDIQAQYRTSLQVIRDADRKAYDLEQRVKKAERAANLLADSHRRAEQAEAAIARVTSPAGIRAAAMAIGDAALTHLGRDLGTIHVEFIAEVAIRAALDEPKEPRP